MSADDQDRTPPPQQQEPPGATGRMEPEPADEMRVYAGRDLLRDKVALVTGGDSGIGRAVCVAFAKEGADVALAYLSEDADAEHTAKLVRAEGRRCVTLRGDLGDARHCVDVVDRTVAELGRIDALVAAAGIDSWGAAWELTDEQWQTMIDVNLTGVWQSAKAVTPQMIRQRGGSLVLIGSVLSHKHNEGFAHYTAAKHGVLGLARAFALELAPHMIRANSIDPTAVATDMTLNQSFLGELSGRETGTVDDAEERLRRWNAMPLLMVEPVDIANAALFLASDESRYVTGISLPVDLGALLK
jgi:NAD(P)-dependent dehydrogenase (short-subunit alcohol dehydrogenase family)